MTSCELLCLDEVYADAYKHSNISRLQRVTIMRWQVDVVVLLPGRSTSSAAQSLHYNSNHALNMSIWY